MIILQLSCNSYRDFQYKILAHPIAPAIKIEDIHGKQQNERLEDCRPAQKTIRRCINLHTLEGRWGEENYVQGGMVQGKKAATIASLNIGVYMFIYVYV